MIRAMIPKSIVILSRFIDYHQNISLGTTSHVLWCLPHSYNVLAWGQSLQMFLEFNLLGAGKLSEDLDL